MLRPRLEFAQDSRERVDQGILPNFRQNFFVLFWVLMLLLNQAPGELEMCYHLFQQARFEGYYNCVKSRDLMNRYKHLIESFELSVVKIAVLAHSKSSRIYRPDRGATNLFLVEKGQLAICK